MTTPTAVLNADGSETFYFYGSYQNFTKQTDSASNVAGEVPLEASDVTNNAAVSSLPAVQLPLFNLAVEEGLMTGSALLAWATSHNIQVTGIFSGTPTNGAPTYSESMVTALNDPNLTTAANVPTLNQATAHAAITAQAAATTAGSTGPTTIPGDNPVSDQVQEAYIAYYGRPADVAGLAYWTAQLNQAGGNLNAIINGFGNSAESTALYGGQTVAQQVASIYQQEFNRAPDAAGAAYWQTQISSGAVSAAAAALAIFNGATGTDQTTINDKLVVANAFTNGNASDSTGNSLYSGSAAAVNGRAYLSAVTSSSAMTVQLAGIHTQVAHDIQASITGDLTSVGATATAAVAVQLVGVHTAAIAHAVILA